MFSLLKSWYDPGAFKRMWQQESFARFVLVRGVIQFGLIATIAFYVLGLVFTRDLLTRIEWWRALLGWVLVGAVWACGFWTIPRAWRKLRGYIRNLRD